MFSELLWAGHDWKPPKGYITTMIKVPKIIGTISMTLSYWEI